MISPVHSQVIPPHIGLFLRLLLLISQQRILLLIQTRFDCNLARLLFLHFFPFFIENFPTVQFLHELLFSFYNLNGYDFWL